MVLREKLKKLYVFSLKTIEFTVALQLHLYFASAALLARPGWARAGGRAGLGQDWWPTGGAALAAVSELGLFVGWAGRAGCLGWAGAGSQWAGLACRLCWRLSASWWALGLAGWFVGWAGQAAGQ